MNEYRVVHYNVYYKGFRLSVVNDLFVGDSTQIFRGNLDSYYNSVKYNQ